MEVALEPVLLQVLARVLVLGLVLALGLVLRLVQVQAGAVEDRSIDCDVVQVL